MNFNENLIRNPNLLQVLNNVDATVTAGVNHEITALQHLQNISLLDQDDFSYPLMPHVDPHSYNYINQTTMPVSIFIFILFSR